jgi:hypothetical protein
LADEEDPRKTEKKNWRLLRNPPILLRENILANIEARKSH